MKSCVSRFQTGPEAEVIKYNQRGWGWEAILVILPAVLVTARTGYLIKKTPDFCYITSIPVFQEKSILAQRSFAVRLIA